MSEVDLGRLSESERRLFAADDSPVVQDLKVRLADDAYESERAKEWYEHAIKEALTKGEAIQWQHVQAFADWTARLALVRDKQQRMRLET